MRRVLLIVGLLAALVLIAVATVPFWLGPSLRTVAPRYGLSFKEYERLGYSRFALAGVTYRTPTLTAEVDRVELTSPVTWLWQRTRGKGAAVQAGRWAVTVTPQPEAPPDPAPTTESGWLATRTTAREAIAAADTWVRSAQLGPGTVTFPGGELKVEGITWQNRELTLKGATYQDFHVDATLAVPATANELTLTAQVNDGDGTLRVVSRGSRLDAQFTVWNQPGTLTARFPPRGWLPDHAELIASNWTLPGDKLKLKEYYETAQGNARVNWSDGRYAADITLRGTPIAEGKMPPLDVALRGQGDLQTLQVDAFRAQLPGITAGLNAPFAVNRQGRIQGEPARIGIEVTLADQPWIPATGTVRGEVTLTSGDAAIPHAAFQLQASDVVAEGVALAAADARGTFHYPELRVESVNLSGADGTKLTLEGGYNTETKLVQAVRAEGEISRTTLARWLPAQPTFDTVAIKAEAAGALADLEHRGSTRMVGVSLPGWKPLELNATWNGAGRTLAHFSTQLRADNTLLTIEGSLGADSVQLSEFHFAPDGASALRLQRPATLRWKPDLQIEGLELNGPNSGINAAATWGPRGSIELAVRGVTSAWLKDLLAEPGPKWGVSNVALIAQWDHGPMTFATTAGASVTLDDRGTVIFHLDARGDPKGVRLAGLRAETDGHAVIAATGFLPATLTPGGSPMLQIDREGALALNADTVDHAAFWRQIGEMAGLNLSAPKLTARLSGTWQKPEGTVTASVRQIAFDPKRFPRPLPVVDDLNLKLNGTMAGVTLEQLAFKVAGQAVSAEGRLQLPNGGWEAVRRSPLEVARRGTNLRIQIPDADLAAFENVLPEMIIPRGRLSVDAAFRDETLSGGIHLKDAATRPLGPAGALHEIAADIHLNGQTLELRSVSAQMGGETVQLSGSAQLPDFESWRDEKIAATTSMRYDLAVEGKNLPFVRRTGLLVRGDVDLKLASSGRAPPEISGTVRLRDSLFLQDVRSLLPGDTRSKANRPPYFAVEAEPFDAWRLNVDVVGTEFMRLRATGFNGVASARFQLGGTLGEPVLLGDATIDRGQVKFPFAAFSVDEGRVSLTRANPFEPQIWLVATTRRYEFDLKLEVSGSAADPEVKFESTPPLEHGQVLQMVLAGIVPNPDVTLTQQQRVTQLGAFIGQNLLSSFGDANDSSRLTITTGEDISERGRETYRFDYAMNDRWSLTGEYDQYDTHTVGVKWEAIARGGSAVASSASEREVPDEASQDASQPEPLAEPADLEVNGLGFLGDREAQASLERLLGAERLRQMDTNTIEDAIFLLMSSIKEKGYLQPELELVITTRAGENVSFQFGPELTTELPRRLLAQKVVFNVGRGQRFLVSEVDFSGLTALKDEKARAFFAGEAGLFKRDAARVYTPARIKRGVESLAAELRSRGFGDAEVTAGDVQIDDATGAVSVPVRVEEGLRWQISAVQLEGQVADEANVPDITRHVGEPWTESVQQDIAAEIRQAHLAAGYPDVRVVMSHTTSEPTLAGDKAVSISAKVTPGPRVTLGNVRYEGVVKTQESILDRRVENTPGEPLDLLALERARYRISRLGVFERVELQLEPGDGAVRDAVFKVVPGRELELNLLAGYNTYEQLRAGVEFRQYNVFGRAHQTRGLLVQSLKSSRGEYSYTVPELFGENLHGTARVYGLQREEVAFLRKEYGVKLSVDTPLRFLGVNATAGYTFEVLRNEDNELETSLADETQVEVASVDGTLIRDRRDNPLLPRDGYRIYARAEAAAEFLGGRAQYQRFEFGGSYHRPAGEDRWWHFAATHGLITTFGEDTDRRLPVNRRFFPGGDGSIRGYNNGEAAPRASDGRFIGAKSFTHASVEFEQMLVANFSGVVFFDALGIAAKFSDYPYQETLFAAGLGVRYQTVVGPIRAEYGYNLKRRPGDPAGTFHFSIGFPF